MTASDKNKLKKRLLENLKVVEQEDQKTIDTILASAGPDAADLALYSFAMGVILAWIELDLESLDLLGKANQQELFEIESFIAEEWAESYLD